MINVKIQEIQDKLASLHHQYRNIDPNTLLHDKVFKAKVFEIDILMKSL